jgi:hypothetical protein
MTIGRRRSSLGPGMPELLASGAFERVCEERIRDRFVRRPRRSWQVCTPRLEGRG